MSYKNIAYAPLNLDFNHRLFALEYDKLILPHSKPIVNGQKPWEQTRKLNQTWGMISPDTYDKCSIELLEGGKIDHKEIPQWNMFQLMYLETTDDDLDIVKQQAYHGGVFLRNLALHHTWKVKPAFEKLKIVEFIKTLPFEKIVNMHCVSLEPGCFASIHRDSRWFSKDKEIELGKPNVSANNGVVEQGFVVITLNISDGGVPLYWAFDGKYINHAYHANDPVYLTSDYFLHGVPVCTSRRRQIRVTGIPTDELQHLIDQDNKITIPPDMEYDSIDQWYPG